MISLNLYQRLNGCVSLVLSEHKELGLGVDGDVHVFLGGGHQGTLGILALLPVTSQTCKLIVNETSLLFILSYHRRICRLLSCMKPPLHTLESDCRCTGSRHNF